MRDYGKFLNQMAGNTPQTDQFKRNDELTLENTYETQASADTAQSDIPMESVEPVQLASDVYYDQSDIPMEAAQPMGGYDQSAYGQTSYDQAAYAQNGYYDQSADQNTSYEQPAAVSEPAPGKRYSADAYERASNYGYAMGMANQPYVPIRERRTMLAQNSDESMVLGTIGAVIGAALGVLVWYLIGLAGYIAMYGALAIVAGSFFGYLLLGKGFGRGGALVVGVVIIISVFVGTRLLYGHEFCVAFQELKDNAAEYMIDESDVYVPTLYEASFSEFDSYMDFINSVEPGYRQKYNETLGLSYLFVGIASIVFFTRRLRH